MLRAALRTLVSSLGIVGILIALATLLSPLAPESGPDDSFGSLSVIWEAGGSVRVFADGVELLEPTRKSRALREAGVEIGRLLGRGPRAGAVEPAFSVRPAAGQDRGAVPTVREHS
jgi:hypothetical protein